MFTRYLGGGIGHLEQFPPADHNHEDPAMNDNSDVEIEIDDSIVGDNNGSNNSDDEGCGNEGGGDEGSGDEGGGDEGEEDDEAGVHSEEDNQGESSDEEMGNIY